MSSTPSQPDLQKETLWRERLSAQAASGLGVRDGCRQQGDSDSLFHFWKSTLAKRDGTYTPPPRKTPAPPPATKAQPAFAQVVVSERQTKTQATAAPPQRRRALASPKRSLAFHHPKLRLSPESLSIAPT